MNHRDRLIAKIADLAKTSHAARMLVFTNNKLEHIGDCDWSPDNSAWKNEMRRMRSSGATGYFIILRRTRQEILSSDEDITQLLQMNDLLDLALIQILRWP